MSTNPDKATWTQRALRWRSIGVGVEQHLQSFIDAFVPGGTLSGTPAQCDVICNARELLSWIAKTKDEERAAEALQPQEANPVQPGANECTQCGAPRGARHLLGCRAAPGTPPPTVKDADTGPRARTRSGTMDPLACEVPKDEQIAELLRRLHAAESDHHNACETIAKMHAAAVGEVRGPARGVVEDVVALKAERDALEARLKLATEHIVWCGGADDFAPTGRAREGWLKGPGAFLDEQLQGAKPAPHCCLPGCGKPAEYGIWPDPSHAPDMATEACEAHVGALLYEGINSVHPVG